MGELHYTLPEGRIMDRNEVEVFELTLEDNMRVCVCVRARAYVCVCVRVCVRACVRVQSAQRRSFRPHNPLNTRCLTVDSR